MLLPGTPPGLGLPQLFDQCYEPLWQVCAELGVPVNHHTGSAAPPMGPTDVDAVVFLLEVSWWAHRALTHLIVGGALDRHPDLQFVFTEQGTAWVPDELGEARLLLRSHGQRRRLAGAGVGAVGRRAAVAEAERVLGASVPRRRQLHPPRRGRAAPRRSASTASCGAATTRTRSRATRSRTRRCAAAFAGVPTDEVAMMLGGNAAQLYGFDLDLLRPIAAECGPTRRRHRRAARPGRTAGRGPEVPGVRRSVVRVRLTGVAPPLPNTGDLMATKVGQYCIYVSDIEKAEEFYTEVVGLKVQSRTEIDDVHEIVVAADDGGGRLQLAERYNGGQPIDHGFALWKIYFIVDDAEAIHDKAVAYGCESTFAPTTPRPLAGDRRVLPRPRRLPGRAPPVRRRLTSSSRRRAQALDAELEPCHAYGPFQRRERTSRGARMTENVVSSWDDFPVHQSADWIRHVATSDRNFYDRYYFNAFDTGGEFMTVIGPRAVPEPRCHRRVRDRARGRQAARGASQPTAG